MARPRTTSDEEILRAAARAVGRHGIGGLTLAAVAGEAGLAPATLVQRFGSKRGLLLALAEQGSAGGAALFAKAREEHRSPLEALHAAVALLAADVSTREELANSLSFLQLDLTDPEFREQAATGMRHMRRQVAALLADAVTVGELAAGTDVERLARAVQVAYNGALLLWALMGEDELAQALRADVEEVLLPHRTTP